MIISRKPIVWKRDSLEEVHATLSSNMLNKKFEVKAFGAGDGLVTRGR